MDTLFEVFGKFSQLFDGFWQWGTQPNVLPYIPTFLILVAGFAGMWFKPHWATIPHELGHAFVALILGKKLSGININRDSSGDTRTAEYRSRNPLVNFFMLPFRWVRNLLVSFAGYPAPFALAFALIYFWSKDQSRVAALMLLVMLIFTFLYSTNFYGFMLVLGGLLVMGISLWIETPLVREILIVFLAGGMLSGGVKGIIEAWKVWQQDGKISMERWMDPTFEPQHSDARALSRRTLIPQIVWLVVFSCVGLALTFFTLQHLVLAYS